MKKLFVFFFSLVLLFTTVAVVPYFAPVADSSHSWGGYHWARTSNPFTLKLGDNLSSGWKPFLTTTSADWSVSTVLDTAIVTGGTNPRNCRATGGRIEVCNYKYGSNGWLGLAQIWISGSHITQGVTKVNDTYFSRAQYNTPAWKNLVLCQEVGHTFGLNHQDESFSNSNLGTCMDYTDDPSGSIKNQLSNERSNAHDYDQLASIYLHLNDGFTTIQSSTAKFPFGQSVSKGVVNSDFENRSAWGRELRNNGHMALYERDLGNNNKLFTFIILAQD